MPRSKKLIDYHLAGKSVKDVIEELLNDLPPLQSIRQSLLNELPYGSKVKIDNQNTVFYVECVDKRSTLETLTLYERIYPEIEFVQEPQSR